MGVPTEESWPGVTMLRDYNLKSFPSWYENRLSLQDKIVRALDTKGFDLLTMLLHYDPLSRIFAQRALLHPYFDNLDKNSLSAVSEERVDLMAGEIPPTLAKVLEDLISIASSELVVEKEEEGSKNEEKEETLDKTEKFIWFQCIAPLLLYQAENFAFYGGARRVSGSCFSNSFKVAKRAQRRQNCRCGNGIQMMGSTSHTN
eukprot:TsM_000340500 transcript=TsM_000340500 gene=TsM_000340500